MLYADLITSNGGSGHALAYVSGSGSIVSATSRVILETGDDYWALTIDGDYAMVYDVDGLLIGDFSRETLLDYPRLDFYLQTLDGKRRMASLTKSGRLMTAAVTEVETLPTNGFTIHGDVAITPNGIFANKVKEVWFLTDEQGRYVCSNGMIIQVH